MGRKNLNSGALENDEKPVAIEHVGEKLNLRQERFCVLFTRPGTDTYNCITLAYAEAYDFDLDSLSKKRPKKKKGQKGRPQSEYDKAYMTCAVSGSRLLKHDKIFARVRARYLELFGEVDNLDVELARLVFQDKDTGAKLSAIRDANKLKKRIGMDDPVPPPGAAPVTQIQIVMPPGTKAKPRVVA